MIGSHQPCWSPPFSNPGRELHVVRHRGRQADEPDVLWAVDDDLLPDGAAGPILEVVNLVQYHGGNPIEPATLCIDHVAQHFSGHHHDVSVAVDDIVTGEQANSLRSVGVSQVGELLIRESLDGCGVERACSLVEREMNRRLGDQGLAGSGRCGHNHRLTLLDRLCSIDLKIVRIEGQAVPEAVERRSHFLRSSRTNQYVASYMR